jgi:hypothetical protein
MRARVTPEELASTKIVDPGWYPMQIVSYKEEPANTDGSTNGLIGMKVVDGKFKGARANKLVNEKGLMYASALFIALGAKVHPETGIDADLSEASLVGRYLDVNIRRGETSRKNAFNEPVDYAPIGSVTKYQVPAAPKA